MTDFAPGSYVACRDVWAPFTRTWAKRPRETFAIVDARVAALHPALGRAIRKVPHLALRAGEHAKSLSTLERISQAALRVPREATVVSIGGGTVGDVATVFAHLHKRGARLIHVPTTLLAAVDSSVGGKGAVNVGGIKNALGVFHAPVEGWLCEELFETLKPAQHREGEAEAWKMAVTLDADVWVRWTTQKPSRREFIEASRSMKARVCAEDSYERTGRRAVLNFGHTFGHVIESLTRYRIRHGEAVAMGMLCALDIGSALGVTPPSVLKHVEAQLPFARRGRLTLAQLMSQLGDKQRLRMLIKSDKKGASATHTRFVVLRDIGACQLLDVPHRVWESLLPSWKKGARQW